MTTEHTPYSTVAIWMATVFAFVFLAGCEGLFGDTDDLLERRAELDVGLDVGEDVDDGPRPNQPCDDEGALEGDLICTGEIWVECEPVEDDQFCEEHGAECGELTAQSRCGDDHTVACGELDGEDFGCEEPEVCEDNFCDCPSLDNPPEEICTIDNLDCGSVDAGEYCAGWGDEYGEVDCGECDGPEECHSHTENVCGCPCDIGGDCHPADAESPDNECLICDPEVDDGDWSPAPQGSECELEVDGGGGECFDGICEPVCGEDDRTACGLEDEDAEYQYFCADLDTDADYCGDCDNECSSDEVCDAGICVNCTEESGCASDEVCYVDADEPICVDCIENDDCTGELDYCNTAESACVECLEPGHCEVGETCASDINECICYDDRDDSQVCDDEDAKCGGVEDNCGVSRQCPDCDPGFNCNVDNQCECYDDREPEDICDDEDAACGTVLDDCDEEVGCGDCDGDDDQCIDNICEEVGEPCNDDTDCSGCQECLDEEGYCEDSDELCDGDCHVECNDAQCVTDEELCDLCEECDDEGNCQSLCESDEVCDEEENSCVPCVEDNDCPSGESCENNVCVDCTADSDCDDGDNCTEDFCSDGTCDSEPFCSGDDTDCGCTSCTNCTADDGWYDVDPEYACCLEGDACSDCQDQEYREYSCDGTDCTYTITKEQTVANGCTTCDDHYTCEAAACVCDDDVAECCDNDDCGDGEFCNADYVCECEFDDDQIECCNDDHCDNDEECDDNSCECSYECCDDGDCDDDETCNEDEGLCECDLADDDIDCCTDEHCDDNDKGDYCRDGFNECAECTDDKHCMEKEECCNGGCIAEGDLCVQD